MSGADHRLITGLKALAPGKDHRQPGTVSPGEIQAGENGSLLSLESLVQRRGEPLPVNQLLGVCEAVYYPQGQPTPLASATFQVERTSPDENTPGQAPAENIPGQDPAIHQSMTAASDNRSEAGIAPGSLLVVGDPGSGKTRLVRRLLINAAAHNTPEQAGFYLTAHQPAQFCDIGHLEHCRLVMQTYDRSLGPAVQELVDLAEERRAARQPGPSPAVILAIDDLASALLNLGEQTVTLLYWLIRHGPRQRVWTLATLSTRRLADLDLRFLEAFRSRLVGHISDPDMVQMVLQSPGLSRPTSSRDLPRRFVNPGLPTWSLEKGRQFFLPFGSGWVRFRLCEPQAAYRPGPVIRLWSGTA